MSNLFTVGFWFFKLIPLGRSGLILFRCLYCTNSDDSIAPLNSASSIRRDAWLLWTTTTSIDHWKLLIETHLHLVHIQNVGCLWWWFLTMDEHWIVIPRWTAQRLWICFLLCWESSLSVNIWQQWQLHLYLFHFFQLNLRDVFLLINWYRRFP